MCICADIIARRWIKWQQDTWNSDLYALQWDYVGNGAKYDQRYYCSPIGLENRIYAFNGTIIVEFEQTTPEGRTIPHQNWSRLIRSALAAVMCSHAVSSIRDLAVYIDADMTMRTHVTAVVRACFAALRQMRSAWRSLSRRALLTLGRALIVSKVDYCNSVIAGISGQLQDRLQSVLNAAARLVFSARRSERTTPLLRVRELHWLRVPERVTFRLCVLVYRCLHGTAPSFRVVD